MRPAVLAACLAAVLPWHGAGAQDALVARGEAVYTRICAMCHSPTGPATVILGARLGADRARLNERRDLLPVYIRHVIRNGIGTMPHITKIEVPDSDADAVVAYLTRLNPQ